MKKSYHRIEVPLHFSGLGTAIGCITSYESRKPCNAFCVRTMRFLHLTVRFPYQGLFPVRLSHNVKDPFGPRRSRRTPKGKSQFACLDFLGERYRTRTCQCVLASTCSAMFTNLSFSYRLKGKTVQCFMPSYPALFNHSVQLVLYSLVAESSTGEDFGV